MSIGLAGAKESGKSTVAQILQKHFHLVPSSFAEPLRIEVDSIIRGPGMIPREIALNPKHENLLVALLSARHQNLDVWAKPTSSLARYILQVYGTEFRRAEDEDYWVDRCEYGAVKVWQDVRNVNEFRLCDRRWYVLNPEAETRKGSHVSENTITPDMCDLTILNDGTVDELEQRVIAAYTMLL